MPAGTRNGRAKHAALRAERDQALKLARRRAEFASHASHEIRTPLHGIVGYSTLLLGTELTDEQRGFANALRTSVESLLGVVSDVLDVSRLDAGAMALERTGFDLGALVRGVTQSFEQAAGARRLALTVDTDAVTHPHLVGDPGRVRQVLVNLVGNAVKFTDAGSVIVRAETGSKRRGRITVRVSVTDTGPGIPTSFHKRLFQPFSRLENASASNKPGTGLGLSISKQLVELMGGTLVVDSAPGRGSTFAFELHLSQDLRPAAQRELELFDVSSLRTYVADDDRRSRRELLLSLAAAGVGVVGSGPAISLPEALRTAFDAGTMADLVIVGHVDHVDGDLVLARTIKADPRLSDVKLVLAPVAGIRGRAREARDAGYVGYMPRPFGHADLLECARAVAARSFNAGADASRGLITRHSLPAGSGAYGRVLIADDDAASREVTRLQIERLGFVVDTVVSGDEAVAAAARGRYDAILMDCQMAATDGLAAAVAIRGQAHSGHRPVILAMTADVSARQRERCRRAGMDGFLEKPVRTRLLASALDRYVRSAAVTDISSHQIPEGPAVDRSAFELLEADVGSEMTLDLIREYLAGAEQTIDVLESVSLQSPIAAREAHRLLGGARILGLAQLARHWQTLDRDDDGDQSATSTTIGELRRACADLRNWMQAHQRNQHV